MKFRIAATIFFLLFLFHSIFAQDTIKHARKRDRPVIRPAATAPIEDSVKASSNTSESYIKDAAKRHVKMPTYSRDGYIAISGGLGMPTGALAVNACASTGSVFSLTAAFPGIISHCGFAFKFDYGTNAVNKNQLLDTLQKDIGLSTVSYSFAGVVESYSYKTILTGLYLTYPGKYVTIDGRILGGVMKATVPALTFNVYDQVSGNTGTVYEAETSAFAFALDFGIEVRYHFKPKFSVILSADYLHSVPSFLVVGTGAALTSTGSIVQISGREMMGGDQPFDLYTISIGVGYTISAQKNSASKTN